MMHAAYLVALLVSIGCICLVDRRWRLVLWSDPLRAAVVVTTGAAAFLAWDFAAVHEGFYRRGGSDVMTGLQIAPDVPLEEVFFVVFLCYVTIVLHRLVARVLGTRRRREDPAR